MVLLTVTMMLVFFFQWLQHFKRITIKQQQQRLHEKKELTRQNTSAAMRPRKCKPCKVFRAKKKAEWNIAASVCVEYCHIYYENKIVDVRRFYFTYTLQIDFVHRECAVAAFYDEIVCEFVETSLRAAVAALSCTLESLVTHSDFVLRVHFDTVQRRDALFFRPIAFANSQNESDFLFV